MNRYALLLAVFTMLAGETTLSAQSQPKQGPVEMHVAAAAYIAEPIQLETPTATLFGTLMRPQLPGPVPVALIISGSGPTDRDGNSPMLNGPNNSLKLLAEGLAVKGIASVRYDKRGIGESGKAMMLAAEKANIKLREEDLLFDDFIEDAVLWGKKLRDDRRFSSVIIIGHSEGSLLGMVAAQRMGAKAYVSIAGSGRPAQQLLLEQFKAQLSPELFQATENAFNQLAAGKKVESVPPALNALLRPSVQPYLTSWFHYDPAKEIAGLKVPILIVQGTTDIQVSVQDAKALSGANPSAKLVLVDGMNHVLKLLPAERGRQIASYSDPSLPVAPELIHAISEFVGRTGE